MGHSWASTNSRRSGFHCDRHLDVAEGIVGANYFPNVPLITQHGAIVHFYDDLLTGKAVAINVIYTSCKDECPLETARLVQVQRLPHHRTGGRHAARSRRRDETARPSLAGPLSGGAG